jgi:hypothetical protein
MDSKPELIFHVEISGTTTPMQEIRLSFYNDGKKLSYIGDYRDSVATFKLKDIDKFLDAGMHDYELEAYVGNQYFIPFAGKIELVKPVSVSALPVLKGKEDTGEVSLKVDMISKTVTSIEKDEKKEIVKSKVERIESKPIEPKKIKKSKAKLSYIIFTDKIK